MRGVEKSHSMKNNQNTLSNSNNSLLENDYSCIVSSVFIALLLENGRFHTSVLQPGINSPTSTQHIKLCYFYKTLESVLFHSLLYYQ